MIEQVGLPDGTDAFAVSLQVEDVGSGVSEVVVELPPLPSTAPSPLSSGDHADHGARASVPAPAGRGGTPPALLRDPVHRQALRTRDQVCPWFM